ncbi:Translocation protein S62 [Gnomoniopsis smithogilvyi]|uniref:Translocation protein SEC62 n=1 Tax=Gnomoniopsis smithogilvyi TaxID=1191159 RepID=A0A9W9CT34_9PEZI|nr:Translocation protein S62 [Gnomoniopsis smithogilvyi]
MKIEPGQQPTPEQMEQIKAFNIQAKAQFDAKVAEQAAKEGVPVETIMQRIQQQAQQQRAAMMARMQQQAQQQQQQGGQPGQPQPGQGQQHQGHQHPHPHQHGPPQQGVQQPITPGPPNPVAIAMANFLRGQDLKTRTCILNGERKDMFRVKRAMRALQSPAYEKARKKNPALPAVVEGDRASLENAFKLLPLSMLALRVEKIDPSTLPNPPKKRVKGLWNVKIVGQQDAGDDLYYAWLYEGSQVKRKVYALLALVAIFTIVLYPLWPLKMRQGVYYLSWGFLWLLAGFFAMAIFRVILFGITYFVASPGLWLFPNLWEDVSFVDSFKPVWAWHETAKKKKKSRSSGSIGSANAQSTFAATTGQPLPASATTTATETQIATGGAESRQRNAYAAPRVEELADDEE